MCFFVKSPNFFKSCILFYNLLSYITFILQKKNT